MPSWTMPTFSKIPLTSQDTQPAMFAICQASGSTVATTAGATEPLAHSVTPIAAVPTTSIALRQ